MFLDYSGYEALTEINSSFGKYVLLLQQFEGCRSLKDRLQMLKDLGREFMIFENLNVEDFRESKNMIHRFYTMVISLRQIMEIGPLVRRSPAVLVVEFDCPVEDCLDELDPLHPLNRAYIFIHKQWTYYHQYYIVEKVKKVILDMAPVKEDDWSILHKVVYSEGFVERRYKKKKYLGDIYIPQPLMKSNKITTISNFSQLTKISNVRVYRFNATAACDPQNLNKKNLSIKELKDKDLPNLIWTLEPEKFYVDMRPYKEHEERKKRREEEAKVRMQGEEQENIMIERKKMDSIEVEASSGLKNIIKTPLANRVVNTFNNCAAVVIGYVTEVDKVKEDNEEKNNDRPKIANDGIAQKSRSESEDNAGTPMDNAYFQPEPQDNDQNNISWNTTMKDIDPIYMSERCARVWRKEQQMLGLEKAQTFEKKYCKDQMVMDENQVEEPGKHSERRTKNQVVRPRTKIASSASKNDNSNNKNSKSCKNCHKEEAHGLVREYLKIKLNISPHGERNQRTKDKRKCIMKYNASSNNINKMAGESEVLGSTILTDIHFKDVVTVKFRDFKAKFKKVKINA
ncbi:BBL_G0033230.mRNA.1.CDS.1 [Saccharomyces cerevisiae]|nr:BBL_G0033230.mRNA.1.CDS.1 [Saccharomyces cerevisiae]CAI7208740.1 BBL_G0033230.mRNA.1.CDS.1 [Saccharomyces cerevisiae]